MISARGKNYQLRTVASKAGLVTKRILANQAFAREKQDIFLMKECLKLKLFVSSYYQQNSK
jgi:hypothetical protein